MPAYVLERYRGDGTRMWRVRGPRLAQVDGSAVGADPASVAVTRHAIYVVGTSYGPGLSRDLGLTVARYSMGGALRWRRSVRTDEWWDVPSGIAVRGGAVAVAGYRRNQGEGWLRRSFVLGFASDGRWLWSTSMRVSGWPRSGVQVNDITSGIGGFYLTGSVLSGAVAGTRSPEHAIVVRAMTVRGVDRWTRVVGSDLRPDFDLGLAVSANHHRVAVAGSVDAVPKDDPSGRVWTTRPHAWAAQYTLGGKQLWADRRPKVARWEAVDQLGGGHIRIAGATTSRETGPASRAVWRELDQHGDLVWSRVMKRPAAKHPPWPTDLDHRRQGIYVASSEGLTAWRMR
jgi:hypothetical protein